MHQVIIKLTAATGGRRIHVRAELYKDGRETPASMAYLYVDNPERPLEQVDVWDLILAAKNALEQQRLF